MKIIIFILIGFAGGYITKDLLTTESQVIYQIKRLRAKKGGEINVESEVTATKEKKRLKSKETRPKRRNKNK